MVLSKALFTRREGNAGARVTLTRGLPSTPTFLLFLHDMSSRKVGLPWHKDNRPECYGYPTCLETFCSPTQAGIYLGFIIWGRSPEWLKAYQLPSRVWWYPPPPLSPGNVLQWICSEMQSGAFWDTILRNVTVCAMTLLHLDDFFQ